MKNANTVTSRSKVKAAKRANRVGSETQVEGGFNMSQFIRDFDPSAHVSEVVEAARKLGHEVKPTYVYSIRSVEKKKANKMAANAKSSKPAPKGAPPSKKGRSTEGFNKSEFIRQHDADVTAKEIVEAAAALGHEIDSSLVYAVRTAEKAKLAGKAQVKDKKVAVRARAATAAPTAPKSAPAPKAVPAAPKAHAVNTPSKEDRLLFTEIINARGVQGAQDFFLHGSALLKNLTGDA